MGQDEKVIEQNARIKRATLGYTIGSGSVLTGCLYFDMDAMLGDTIAWDMVLDDRGTEQSDRTPHAVAGAFISEILRATEADDWADLVGKHLRVQRTPNKILALQPILGGEWITSETILHKSKES